MEPEKAEDSAMPVNKSENNSKASSKPSKSRKDDNSVLVLGLLLATVVLIIVAVTFAALYFSSKANEEKLLKLIDENDISEYVFDPVYSGDEEDEEDEDIFEDDIEVLAEDLCSEHDGRFTDEDEWDESDVVLKYTCKTRDNFRFTVNILEEDFIDNERTKTLYEKMKGIGEGNESDNLTVIEVSEYGYKGYESGSNGYTFYAAYDDIEIELFTTSIAAGENYLYKLGYE